MGRSLWGRLHQGLQRAGRRRRRRAQRRDREAHHRVQVWAKWALAPEHGAPILWSTTGDPATAHIKVLTDDHKNFPAPLSICEGEDLRAVLAVGAGTDAARSGQPSKAQAARQGLRTPLRTVDEAVQRLGITSPRVLRSPHLVLNGVDKLDVPPGDGALVDEAWQEAAMRRSAVRHKRSKESLARDKLIPPGRRWGMDLTCRMPLSVDGKRYGMLFVEKRTLFVFICYLVDKTTSSFVHALRELVVFVRAHLPEAFPIELHSDSDRAWAVTGRGDDTPPAELAEYMANENAMIMRRSASGVHGRCPAESAMGKVFMQTFANQLRGLLGPPTWTDMMRGAANQINDQPAHGRRPDNSKRAPLVPRSEHLLGERPDASARWPGRPGQQVYILNEDGKASAGRPRSRGGYFVGPARGVAAWHAREITGGRNLVATSNLAFIDSPHVLLSALARSDGLLALHGPLRGEIGAIHAATRELFGDPSAPPGPSPVICEPLVGAPVALVPAFDDNGEPMPVRREAWPVRDENPPPAATPPPAVDRDEAAAMLEALLAKQQTQCALALKELNEAGHKLTHWTWWVFPTDHPGASEPPPRTAITAATAGVLLDRAPRLWRKCLGKVRALLKAPGPDTGTLAKVFPPEDWDRIKRFVRFWGRVAKAPPWLKTVLRDLGAAASAAEPGAPRGSTAWLRGLPSTTRIKFRAGHKKREASGTRWNRYRSARTLEELATLNPKKHYIADLKYDLNKGLVTFVDDHVPLVRMVGLDSPAAAEAGPDSLAERAVEAAEVGFHAQRELEESWAHPTLAEIHRLEGLEGVPAGPPLSGEPAATDAALQSLGGGGELEAAGDGLPGPETWGTIESSPWDGERSGAEPAVQVATPAGAPEEVKGISAARRSPHWGEPGGWHDAIGAELHRTCVQIFQNMDQPAILYVPVSDRTEAILQFGAMTVETKGPVLVLKEKRDSEENTTKRSARTTIADVAPTRTRSASTFAACVLAGSVRGICQDAVEDESGDLAVVDVPGAYYNGKPTPPWEAGGRVLYMHIPRGLKEFGFPQFNEHGERMLFRVVENLPGRRDAGLIWGREYGEFMRSEGFVASVVDRRVYYLREKKGKLQITTGVHVDDCISSVRDPGAGARFMDRWCARFGGSRAPRALNALGKEVHHFLGMRVVKGPDTVCLDGPRLIADLERKLAEALDLSGAPPRGKVSALAPLASEGLRRLRMAPGDEISAAADAPSGIVALASESCREVARSLLGISGYVVIMWRPDGSLAYSAISQQIAQNFTNVTFHAALQFAKYPVSTRDLALALRRTGRAAAMYSDSSSMDAGSGSSWGGFGWGQPGSGFTHYRCVSPRHLTDSSGGSELMVATLALKEAIGVRIMNAELGLLDTTKATDLFMDAAVVLAGVAMDRVTRESRYVATRLAMLRQAVADGIIALRKIDTKTNPADIFTKPLVGETLRRLRAMCLGHHVEALGA